VRYAGQSHELTVSVPEPFDPETVARRFHAAHRSARSYAMDDEPVELVTLEVTATVEGDPVSISHEGTAGEHPEPRTVHAAETVDATPVYDRDALGVGDTVEGLSVVEGGESTVVVSAGWTGVVDEQGTLVLEADR
jgi:N-methylhydantoinase A